jgi:imidazole glycerol-phosphate synthase subunit HisF
LLNPYSLRSGKFAKEKPLDRPVKIMPSLDLMNGRVVKGVHFADIGDAGDPVECAKAYCAAGADELGMLDVTAGADSRSTFIDTVNRVAGVKTIPLTAGGGVSDISYAGLLLETGADRVSVGSAALKSLEIISEMVKVFGYERIIVDIDVDLNPLMPSGYEVYIDGGRTATGADAVEWAKRVDGYGVAVILPTSKAGDGARKGYDLPVIRLIKGVVSAEVVASGGAGELKHFYEASVAGATILLAASVFHFGIISIRDLKKYLYGRGVPVNLKLPVQVNKSILK